MANNQSLSHTMKELFFAQSGTDVTFIVHDRIVKAHKIIVTARSPVLRAMIEGPMAPPDQRHEINDPEITYQDFHDFLCFLYTDELRIRPDNFRALLHLADFYDMPYLRNHCIENINHFLNAENVFKYAEYGILYPQASRILRNCFDVCMFRHIPLAYRDIDDNLVWISRELALEFVKQMSPHFSEDELFQNVFEWARNYCIQQNQEVNQENIQEILAPIMPYFNYQNFLPLTVATTVKEYKLLPDETLINCLAGHVVKNERSRARQNPFDIRLDENEESIRGGRGGLARGRGARVNYFEHVRDEQIREGYPRGGSGRGHRGGRGRGEANGNHERGGRGGRGYGGGAPYLPPYFG